MVKKKDSCRLMLAAAVLVAFAYGCGGEESVDHGGSLVSEEGQIAFSRFTRSTPPNFESEIYTINVDGSGEKRLTDSPGLDALPAWSPDGERIAFASEKDGEIYTMNADGSGRTRLTDTPGYDHWPPTWSPDGARIAFTSEGPDGTGEIYVMNSDASGLTRLTDNPADDSFPAWRP